MLALERQRKILDVVRRHGGARVSALAAALRVTEETIRRDLDKLEDEGAVLRSHGGAVPNWSETPHWLREIRNKDEKRAIALAAIPRIREGTRIILDGSTTAQYIARELAPMPLTVVTPSLRAAESLAGKQGIEVLLIGGSLSALSLSTVGSEAEEMLSRYHVDAVYMSCTAVDLDKGVFEASVAWAAMRRRMLQAAETRVLLVDHSKFGARSLSLVAPLEEFQTVMTDAAAPAADCERMAAMGLEVVRAPAS
jgi:DeoR/GlpR family transcriptional regulator of sugar metabolism